jgi:putative flavoprotein involved in K+ transport
MTDTADVLVIGAGQAGLVMGHYLAERRRRFLIVDAGAEIGDAWRLRWDSLKLFTPARFDNLPGLPFPAPTGTYPGKDDVADYLQAYAARFQLPVRLNTRVISLTRSAVAYVVNAGDEALEARTVVVATGPFHVPFVPPIAKGLDPDVTQIHSVSYRHPSPSPLAGSSWSEPRTRAARSLLSSRPPTPSSSRRASGFRRSPSSHWVATCGGGPEASAWTESPSNPG